MYSVCTPFVLRLYPVCIARDVSSLGSLCFRLYSFVFVCASFVLVCTARDVVSHWFLYSVCTRLYSHPFGEYNIIRRREEYKSTKACKCSPSIVLGARWPNGITTARAVAAAQVRPTSQGKGARLSACVCVCVFTKAFVFLFSRTGTLVSAKCSLGATV